MPSNRAPLVSIVVPTLGHLRLESCLRALQEQRKNVDLEILLVVQGDARIADDVRSLADRVLEFPQPIGFAAANNRAFAVARGEFLAAVNDDAVVATDWLRTLVDVLERDEAIAAVQGVNQTMDDPQRIDGRGIAWNRWWQAVQIDHGRRIDLGEIDATEDVFGVSATAAVYRRSALDAVGGVEQAFDERLESYYEDVDLAVRLRRAGFRALSVAAARARHAGSSTLGAARRPLVYGNRYRVLKRHLGGGYLPRLPWIFARDVIDLMRAATRVDSATIRGIVAGWRRAFLASSLLIAAFVACAPAPQQQEPPPRPDVFLITVDTLRADRLGVYGSELETPSIDALAREGLVFDNAVAPLPETRPSHFTLLTGLPPRSHGVTSNSLALGEEFVTLAETFADAGYRTGAFVGCALLGEGSGAEQGFEVLDAPETPQRPAWQVLEKALAWLDEDDDRPVFAWVHLFDPHMPYEPPGSENVDGAPRQLKHFPIFSWPRLRAIARQNDGNLPRWALDRGMRLYDAEVEYVDSQIGVLLKAVAARPNAEQAVTLLTADHGECFAKGVFFDHSFCLDEAALAVPMILRAPGVAPGRKAEIVEHSDVAPTLLDLAGVERSDSAVPGLLAASSSNTAFFQHPLYLNEQIVKRNRVFDEVRRVAEVPTKRITVEQLQIGLRRDDWKYLRSAEGEALFNLDSDLRERRNRAEQNEDTLLELRTVLRRWLKENPLHELEQELSPELQEQLRALGYL